MPSAEPRWPIRSVVFDLDGLLIDSEPIFREAAYRFLARRDLVPCNEILDAIMGRPGAQALEMFRQHHGLTGSIGELAQECSQLFYEVLGHDPVRLMPGAVALLERLERKKIPKAMATSSRRPYVERILKPHGLLHRFDF